MKKKILLFLSMALMVSGIANAQGNWKATNQSISPSGAVSAAGTITVSGTYTWESSNTFINDHHEAKISMALPKSVYVSTGTPSVTLANNTPVAGVIFSKNAGGWNCSFAPGTSFPAGTELIFKVSGLEIKDDQAYNNEMVSHIITFASNPTLDGYTDNVSSSTFSTQLNSALPVGMLSFDARLLNTKENPRVELVWSTATEINASHFMVQRSQNASYWMDVVSVNAKGNTNTTTDYNAFDEEPIAGISYYRLKQFDNNNEFSYSDVRVININSKGSLKVFPNPVVDKITVQYIAEKEAQVEIKVTAVDGRVIQSILTQIKAGANSIELDVRSLAEGVYDLSIYENTSLLSTTKVVKN